MAWVKGQSGNPNGRPKKKRALTRILESAGCKTLEDTDGKRRSGKRIAARLAWEGVTTGEVKLPSGTTLVLSPSDWLSLYKWIYAQVDGPPKIESAIDVTSGGDAFSFIITERDDENEAD